DDDASTHGLLCLRIFKAASRMASLGFEKSYREVIVLMMRSYLRKLSSIGSDESNALPEEANRERVKTLPARFELIAIGLTNVKSRVDFLQRLLSLCSDVGGGGTAAVTPSITASLQQNRLYSYRSPPSCRRVAVWSLDLAPAVNLSKTDRITPSIPLVLDEAVRSGNVKEGDTIITVGFDVGLTWGSAIVRWC
nr:phosphatidylinositol 4-kinase alpha 1-like isoform X2 [Tanacetum cinerariifolium]